MYVLVAVVVIAVIAFVGTHMAHKSEAQPAINQSLYNAVINGQIVVDSGSYGNGSALNAYYQDGSLFPNPPANYQRIYSGTTANDSTVITQDQTALNLGEEADYLTTEPIGKVHSDIQSMCASHEFSFEQTVNRVTYVACRDHDTNWMFSILPAGAVLTEPWYKLDSISESALAKSLWVQIQSGRIVSIH